jgi:hypothetical protein
MAASSLSEGLPMTMHYNSWTPSTKEHASKLWAEGQSIGQIAAALRVDRGSISGLMSRNRDMFPKRGGQGVSAYIEINRLPQSAKSVWTEDDFATASRLWAEGKTYNQIGAVINKTANAISRKVQDRRDLFPRREASGTNQANTASAHAKFINRVGRQQEKRERHALGLPAEPPPLPHHGYDTAVFALPGVNPVRLIDLEPRHCRWPITCDESPKGADTPFCGADRTHGSYCAAHAMISRGRGTVSEQNALSGIGGRK